MVIHLGLFLAGALAFTLSTLTGGGGALMLVPVLGFWLGPLQIAPLLNLGNLIGRPIRLYLYWRDIQWQVVRYYLPASVVGAVLGAWLLSASSGHLIELLVGLFLVSTLVQYRFGKRARSFPMKLWYFIPLGFLVPFVSALTGAMGPILNPFLLNYGVTKEALIGTKSFNSLVAGLLQVSTYTYLGALQGTAWWWGLSLGLGITLGNWVGKGLLSRLTEANFRFLAVLFMVLSGVVMLVRSLAQYL